jgi:large subunit ribosomal protein L31e
MAKLERIYTIPLGDAYAASRNNRVPRAMKLLRQFVARHMKAEDARVVISEALNQHIWERSIQRPPRRVKVRLIREEDSVRAYLADEKIEEKKAKAEEKKEEKAAAPAKKATTVSAPPAPPGSKREAEARKEEKAPEKRPEAKEQKAEHKPSGHAAGTREEKR